MVKGHFNRHNRPEKQLTKKFAPTKTEQTGYVPAKIRIQQMIQSGLRANPVTQGQYDYDGELTDEIKKNPVVSVARMHGS